MRVLVNAISARQGGIVTYTQNLFRGMRARGVDAVFAVPTGFELDGPNILRFDVSEYGPARRLAWEQTVWRSLVASMQPDILYSSANFGLFHPPARQVLLIREGGLFDPNYLVNVAPTLGTGAAFMLGWRRRLMLASARWADRVLTPSAAMRDSLLRWAPRLAKKTDVVTYGTPGDMFSVERRSRRDWRASGLLRLIYVSVYYPHKNPGVICRALEELEKKGVRAEATITMTEKELCATKGGAYDRIQVLRAAAAGRVALGHHPYHALPDLYGAHDIFVFPSVSESFGHPMVEALAMGLNVVAADTPINREICGDAALYFSPFRPSELADRIMQLNSDPALRLRLVSIGRQRTETMFRWDHHVDLLLSCFRQVMNPREGA